MELIIPVGSTSTSITTIMKSKLKRSPYFSGVDRHLKYKPYMDQLPEETQRLVRSESTIAWNRSGGQPSGHFIRALNNTIDALNQGREPQFPNVEFNRAYIARQKAEREAGVDRLTPCLKNLGYE